ncbi:MAG: hypothetical protein ABFD07_16500 [Methanobacterium sp.]
MSNDKIGCKIGNSGFEERACIFCDYKEPPDCFWFREKHGAEVMYRNKKEIE